MDKRRIYIGDIQGCREELERLLEKLRFDPTGDEVHPVGDFVNRGPDSAGTLRVCKSIGAGGVLGNHDVHLLRVAHKTRPIGQRDTFQDVLQADDREALTAWLAARPIVRAFRNVILVHAGLNPTWADPIRTLKGLDPLLDSPELEFAIFVRHCDARGNRPAKDWPIPPEPFRPWHSYWPMNSNEKRTVVFGHWARAGLVQSSQLRGLDTGCVWGGELTAWIEQENRLVQVPAQRSYSPHD